MLDKGKGYVLLGSCFSQNVGERMQAEGYRVVCNPLGTLFNPESIGNTVRHALEGDASTLPMFWDEAMKEWRCWWANTRFRSGDEAEARTLVQDAYNDLGQALRTADHVFLTLGTNVCYRLRENAVVVSNCQRQPDALFLEDELSLDDCVRILCEIVELTKHQPEGLNVETGGSPSPSSEDSFLWKTGFHPSLHLTHPTTKQPRITFTLSPFRYRKYGWHRSQLSKATLLLAIDQVCRIYPERVDYFPSYEIMMDELRDYAYYAEDGLHPSPQAVDIIWRCLNS